jgi:hypothetical protein
MFAVSDMRQVPFADSGFSGIAAAEAFGFAVVALLAIWLTYIGFGSIVLWAFRFAIVQFGALGTLMSRALPLLMLTVVVYFTGELWQLAARMTRQRLWQTVGFLAIVAIVFMVTTIRDEVLALREDRAEQDDPAKLLADTPLAQFRSPAGPYPAVAGRAGQRRRRDGGRTGDPGGLLHRRPVRVLPGVGDHRHTRRRDSPVVRRRELSGR